MSRKSINEVLASSNKGAFPVKWLYNGTGLHTVKYGEQTKTYTGCTAALHAAAEYSRCLLLSLDCAGLLNID